MTPRLAVRRSRAVWLLSLLLLLLSSAAYGQGAKLDRSKRPKEVWDARQPHRVGADAKPIVDATLKAAGLPEGATNNPWRELIAQYWRLDNLAQAEPRSFTNGEFVPNAWFTHGARHLLDLAILMTDNKPFVLDLFRAQGVPEAAREQAFKDLLIALIGHDSQQVDFADAREDVRKRARADHPFNGGVATALAYMKGAGTNPAGAERAMMLGLAAAGHSKSAVDFANRDAVPTPPKNTRGANVMLADMLSAVNAELTRQDPAHVAITFNATQRDAIVDQAKKIGTVLGAMDALRERGRGAFGSHPTGEHMEYRVEGTNASNRVLVVYNTKESKKVTELKDTGKLGVEHRTYVELHTHVESVTFDGTKFDIRLNFADADIPTANRVTQAKDIQEDFARVGFPCTVRYPKFEGGFGAYP